MDNQTATNMSSTKAHSDEEGINLSTELSEKILHTVNQYNHQKKFLIQMIQVFLQKNS